jgi:predicted metal-dependent hydrolase
MNMQATLTPANHGILVRDLKFNREPANHPRWWHGGDPVPTAFFNALSCTFPAGEKFFMDSVRAYRREVGPDLQAQIKAFLAQEAVHSREHAAFNQLAADSGYDVARLEQRTKSVLDFARKRSKARQLAATCALEHFTAILAHELLAGDSADMAAAPEDTERLWSWHAIEEIEHKAVAYDTFLAATADMTRLRRYVMRSFAMILATVILFTTIRASMRDLYHADGLKGWRIWGRTITYLFGSNGILRRIFPAWLTYFKPGFHPWQYDDRDVLARAQARLGLEAAA